MANKLAIIALAFAAATMLFACGYNEPITDGKEKIEEIPGDGGGQDWDFDYQAWKAQLQAWRTELQPIVANMTAAEKYGQMTQAEYDYVAPRINSTGSVVAGNDVSQWYLGSVVSGGYTGPNSGQGTPAQWVQYTNLLVADSLTTGTKIPVIFGLDAMHGQSRVKNATMLPHNVGLGAIAVGDLEIGKAAGYAAGLLTGKEMRATGVRWTLGPKLEAAQDIRWGRTFECYSENVDIVKAMGTVVIRGIYGGGAAPSSIDFGPGGYVPAGGSGGGPNVSIDAYRALATPYRAAIEAGVMCVMASYGSRNGVRIHEDKELLTGLLKDELGFEGMLITGWDAINQVSGSNYTAKLGKSINAGIDMVMAATSVARWKETITGLQTLVYEGTVSEERIDDAVMRILLFKKAVPGFWGKEGEKDPCNGEDYNPLTPAAGEIRTEEHKAIAADLASKSLVLLKNENNAIEKLKTEYNNILLMGTGADDVGLACGGWTVSWQGAAGATTAGVTLRQAMQGLGKNVTYSAAGTAGDYDAVIAVIAETPYAEGTGDRTGSGTGQVIERSQDAQVLTNALSYGKPVILIIYSGRPLHLGDRFDGPDAIVAAWWPGSEAGTGIADVLFGDKDFVGKTAYTWTKTQGGEAIYPFGHGLRKSGG
jgi:beta-glucosidase